MNISNLVDTDKIIDQVKCDFTPKINFVNIDPTDPLRLGSKHDLLNEVNLRLRGYLLLNDKVYSNESY